MTLALGDALAVALMEHGSSRPSISATSIPAASWARSCQGRDLMHRATDAAARGREDTPMSDVLLEMTARASASPASSTPHGALVGVVTDGDLRRHMSNLLDNVAADVMTRTPRTIEPGALAEDAVAIMNEAKITCLFVLGPEAPARTGILHIHDCLSAGVDPERHGLFGQPYSRFIALQDRPAAWPRSGILSTIFLIRAIPRERRRPPLFEIAILLRDQRIGTDLFAGSPTTAPRSP